MTFSMHDWERSRESSWGNTVKTKHTAEALLDLHERDYRAGKARLQP